MCHLSTLKGLIGVTTKGLMGVTAVVVSIAATTAITPAYANGVVVSDTLTVFFSEAPGLPGFPVDTLSVDESQTQGSSNFFVLGPGFPASTLPFPGPTILLEPDGTISDIVGVCEGCGPDFFAVGFLSDANGPLSDSDLARFLNSELPTFMPETGNPVNATLYLAPGLVLLGDTAQFTSDLETPIPTALPLFATGLGALGLLGWRRKRKAQTTG